jgi:hypothetical protein
MADEDWVDDDMGEAVEGDPPSPNPDGLTDSDKGYARDDATLSKDPTAPPPRPLDFVFEESTTTDFHIEDTDG